MWKSLKKGAVGLHLSWQGGWTNDLTAKNVRIRVGQYCDIALDLDGNLHTRNKQENSYMDAKELANGELQRLTLLQVSDDTVVAGVLRNWKGAVPRPDGWRLLVELEGPHWFAVEPDSRSTHSDMFLTVKSVIARPDFA